MQRGLSPARSLVSSHMMYNLYGTKKQRGSSHVPIMIRLLFTVPVSNAKLERMFPNLKRVNTNIVPPLV